MALILPPLCFLYYYGPWSVLKPRGVLWPSYCLLCVSYIIMGLGQYNSLGEYCGPHTASCVSYINPSLHLKETVPTSVSTNGNICKHLILENMIA